MLHFRLLCVIYCGLMLSGCGLDTGGEQSLQPKEHVFSEYSTAQIPIEWDTDQSLIRLVDYTPNAQGKSYPKAISLLRFHDVFFRPYQVSALELPVSEQNTVSLSDSIDSKLLHPEAIGFHILVHNAYGLNKSAVFPKDMNDPATWKTLTLPVPKRSWRNKFSGKKRLDTASVWVREILPAPQGQTFSDIPLPENASLEFSIAYAPPLGQETALAIPIHQWHQALSTNLDPTSIPVDPSLLETIPLIFSVALLTDEKEELLFEQSLAHDDPALTDLTQGWQEHSIDLSDYAGQKVSLRFSTRPVDSTMSVEEAKHLPVGIWGSPMLYAPNQPSTQQKPNVIFISLDTLRADHLGCYGYNRDTSPAIDAFAQESILFEECIATSSWTLPTHASIFTGLDPAIHGATGNYGNWRLPTRFDTLPELLHDEGYATAAFTEGVVIGGAKGFNQGFDVYSDGVAKFPVPPGTAEVVIGQAMDWLKKHQDIPYFLFLHTYEIHDTYQPPPPFLGKFGPPLPAGISTSRDMGKKEGYLNFQEITKDHTSLMIDRYDEEIAYTDFALSKLFAYLKESGLTDNTMVVLFSDHGEEFYDHDGLSHHQTLYREQLHVPLIIRMPGNTPPQGRIAPKVSQLDLFATIVEALDVDYTPPSTSFSLMPFLTPNGDGSQYTRQYAPAHLDLENTMILSIENIAHKYILRTELSDALSKDWRKLRAMHDTTFESLLIGTSEGEEALFLYPEDKLEKNNQATANPETTKILRSLLKESQKAAANTLPLARDEAEPTAPLSDAEREALEALGYLN